MRIVLVCWWVVGMMMFGFAQKKDKPLKRDIEVYIEKNKDKKVVLEYEYLKDEYGRPLYHGSYTLWDTTGSYVLIKGKFNYGLRDSFWVEYYRENRPKYEGFFEKDMRHGYVKDYNEEGFLTLEGNYRQGKKQGVFKQYYPDGKIEEVTTYSLDLLHGQFQRFFKNGNLSVTGNYYYDQKNRSLGLFV